jgi:hypothetical protein
LRVPRECISWGAVHGQCFRFVGDDATVELSPREADRLLAQPAWAAANKERVA